MRLLLFAFFLASPAGAGLLPPPQTLRVPAGPPLNLAAGCRIAGPMRADARPGRALASGLAARGIAVGEGGPAITLTLTGTAERGAAQQGYRLVVSGDGVLIRAPAPAGLFYGVVTLLQWLDQAADRSAIPPVAIDDAPDLELRGLTIDFRYAGLSEARIRRAIDRAAGLKANLLVWWLQDRLAWTSHPELAGAGALSATTWKALVAFADARYVQMVPYVDAYGHGERYLEHPKWTGVSRGERGFWGGDDLQFCALHPGSWTLFDDLTREAAAVFTNTPYLHIGMDEVGAQDHHLCAACQAAVRELATSAGEEAPYPRARNRFIARRLAAAAARLAKLGRRAMCWDDSATTVGTLAFGPGGIEHVPDGVLPLLWHYDADPAWLTQALARPAARRFPTLVATGAADPNNILRDLGATRAFPQVIGAVATIWEGDVRLFERRWPGFSLALALGWNRSASVRAWDAGDALGPSGWEILADPDAWIPDGTDGPAAARAPRDARAVRFACDFPALKDWRYVWDALDRLAIGKNGPRGVRVRTDRPRAVGACVVYFRSGDGWYRMPDLHPGRGWTVARWHPADALIEGNPAGWMAVDGVRVSLLPGAGARQAAVVDLEFLPD